jgi:hypothetical protein
MPGGRLLRTTPTAVADVVGAADDGDVVLVLPETARLVADDAAAVTAFLALGQDAVGLSGAMVARAAWLRGRADRALEHIPDDDSGVFFHDYQPGDPSLLVVDGTVLDVAHDTRPAVLVVADPARLVDLDAELSDHGSRDLARIFAYRGAAVPTGAPRVVAPDIVALDFWPAEVCAAVVRAAEASGAFGADPDDPVPGYEISLGALSGRLFAHVEDDVAVRVVPVLRQVWPTIEYFGLRDAFVIKYRPGGQAALRVHHDVAQISAAVKLNEGYAGGALTFPRQGYSTAAEPLGGMVVWPSLVTHPHESSPVTRGVKYSLTLWLELPGGT